LASSYSPLRVFISAGESSGDLHASRLIEELRDRTEVTVEGIGGRRMERAGARILYPMEELSVVGLSEVVSRLPALLRAYLGIRRRWRKSRPHLFVPVDFPGFNLRLAGVARSMKVPVMYYIAPQIWAWGEGRAKTLAKRVDAMAVVLPFEEEFFRSRGVPAEYVGHPLVESVAPERDRDSFRDAHGFARAAPLVGLLPGSRRHEVSLLLPVMIEAYKRLKKSHPVCRAAVALADGIPEEPVTRSAREVGINVKIVKGETYDLMESSDVLLAASGSVTLEAALLGKPTIIVYKMSRLTYAVARRVVTTKSIGLVNIVAGRRVVPEYVQSEVEPSALCDELESMLFDQRRRSAIVAGLREVKDMLGGPGASARAAEVALRAAGGGAS
jgi:lipid-A-disaccharide synthase